MSEVFLVVEDLTVRYGAQQVLQPVSFELKQGERLALIGESGSGKTTLAMAIAGLLPANAKTAGTIRFSALAHEPRAGRDIGVVFQDPDGSLDPMMRVGDQIAEVIVKHLKTSWAEARQRAAELMQQVQIADSQQRLRSYPHEFSGGQKQRIAIAAALAAEPQLLIADEPTSALDTVVQNHVAQLLDGLVRAQGLTMLFVTHDIALASQLADRIAVLYRGRLVELGTVEQVITAPQHDYTKALLATHIGLDWEKQPHLPEIDGVL
ncbi:ABC transporter ATP-binding protein [Pseudochrobactrum asaccharolyticum]|uniref:Peptide/nickel transport system ATP-binding protein n=1 Tax=Pseudochrobactrum asaccharolyticum TaxID=354351 RepID=A0A366E5U8_9HYPH|nr:ABC transporter ATP-binding protein [Pseudochrobactrum asaccharolyticum]RBO97455.1 peptide/nickel transport system ATP-binding protein [Pseudochrobactrum asaccharolyticum]